MNNEIDLPQDISSVLHEIAGTYIKITNTSLCPNISYCIMTRESSGEDIIKPDERLEYVIRLIKKSFIYRSVLMPFIPVHCLGKEDLTNPIVWNKMINELNSDFLDRLEEIPRGNFTKDKVVKVLTDEFVDYLSREDYRKVDLEKLYLLTLFIYDYVQFSFQEMALNQFIKLGNVETCLEVDDEKFRSTALIDDMLIEYITHPFAFKRDDSRNIIIRQFKDGEMYVPSELKIEKHPQSNVNNMTAMFFDLFRQFFMTMNLTKRKGASLSELETNLIAKLARICKICNTDRGASVAAMYKQHKNYFLECKLYSCIRENEYGHLMLNNLEKEMFCLDNE